MASKARPETIRDEEDVRAEEDYRAVQHSTQETSLQMLRSLPEDELVHRYDLITHVEGWALSPDEYLNELGRVRKPGGAVGFSAWKRAR